MLMPLDLYYLPPMKSTNIGFIESTVKIAHAGGLNVQHRPSLKTHSTSCTREKPREQHRERSLGTIKQMRSGVVKERCDLTAPQQTIISLMGSRMHDRAYKNYQSG